MLADLRKRLSVIQDAYVLTIPPPPVQGLGSAGGFKMMLEDRAGLGSQALVDAAQALVAAANKDPDFAGVFTLFNTGSPSVYADIDRVKAEKVGLTPTDVFSTLQVYLGSQYVNDFNYLGRTYQVIVQADGRSGATRQDIRGLKARNAAGEMVPIGTVADLKDDDRSRIACRATICIPAAEVQGVAAPGVATGTALHRMEELAHAGPAARHRLRMDRARLSAAAEGHADPARLRRRRRSSSSSCWPRNTRAGSCRWRSC